MPSVTEPPEHFEATLDWIVAANIRSHRESHGYSRTALAQRLTDMTGEEWSPWRLIDLEGARSRLKEPRSATWSELVALTIVLDTTLFDLVLPPDDTVVAAPFGRSVNGTGADGWQTAAIGYATFDRDQLARAVFRIPSQYLAVDILNESSFGHLAPDAIAESLIKSHAELTERLETYIEEMKRQSDPEESA